MAILTEGSNNLTGGGNNLIDTDFSAAASTVGPLVQSGSNPCFFEKPDGTVIFLNGSHTWNNHQDWVTSPLFDYDSYIAFMAAQNSNFMRMWMWDTVEDNLFALSGNKYSPLIYGRSGTAGAADGGNKFDLTTYNSTYFTQLHDRVSAANDLGIYVSVMLFQGWSIYRAGVSEPPSPWTYHPYKLANNVNSINGDPGGTNGSGIAMHNLSSMPAGVLALQKAYVAHVIDTLNDLPNVLYEISNESPLASASWQDEITDYIHTYQNGLTNQHPVWRTIAWSNADNSSDFATIFSSHGDAVSSGTESGAGSLADDPQPAPGTKVVIVDTDHTRPSAATIDAWVWKCFLHGYNVAHMDSANNITGGYGTGISGYDTPMRKAMKQAADYADRCDLSTTVPNPTLSNTGFCAADPGVQYLALAPSGGSFTVNLSSGAGQNFTVEWLKVSDGTVNTPSNVAGGSSTQSFTSPFSTNASVLFLNAVAEPILGTSDRRPARLRLRAHS